MSNSSSPVVMRISPAALVFLVLMLIMGALTLAATNINPGSTTRAEFTPEFTTWSSPDGIVEFDYPSGWQPSTDQTQPLTYQIVTPRQEATIRLFMGSVASLTQGLTLSATPDPEELLRVAFTDPTNPAKVLTINKTTVSGLPAANVHDTFNPVDQTTGQKQLDPNTGLPINRDFDVWVVQLDAKNIMIVQAVADTENWPGVQPGFEHIMQTLKINTTEAITQLQNLETLTPAPTPGSAATEAASAPASAEATAAPTAAK